MKEIRQEEIEGHFDRLAEIGNLGPSREDGFLRAAWSDEESAAFEYIREHGESSGLSASYDPIGNLFLRLEGDSPETIQVGSHLDTVPRGGLYDGGAGIVCGLEAICSFTGLKERPSKSLELVIWRGEESGTFSVVFKGSKAAFGDLPPDALSQTFGGLTLEQAIASQGFDPSVVSHQKPTQSQDRIDRVSAHIELHIEQSILLEREELDIGIVTSIRGPRRYKITVRGEAGHSGTTPMGAKYRRDANLAVAYMLVEIDKLYHSAASEGKDLVQTVGVLNSSADLNQRHSEIYTSAVSKIAELAYFTLDIRSDANSVADAYASEVLSQLRAVAERFSVELGVEEIGSSPALESLDQNLQQVAADSCERLGFSSILMPSGAGHDVAVVARQQQTKGTPIPCLLLFIPCRNGISHNPKEYSSPEALHKGARVIQQMLKQLMDR